MSYYIFRNMTIESFFGAVSKTLNTEINYSGYEDISEIVESDGYVWWYLAPYKAENTQAAAEIENYSSMLSFTLSRLPATKSVIAITIEPIFENTAVTSYSEVREAIKSYNRSLYLLKQKHSNLKVIDFSTFTTCYSIRQLIDWKYYLISHMALNPRLANEFAIWFRQQIMAIEFNRKKCLVLDLDNTIWGGIVGEDGIHGIKIGGDYPGNAFLYFQQYILELQRQGVMLAVCSKNNLLDIQQVWANNKSNLIKEENLVAYRINWQDKATNIAEIAKELNIGVDSMVFIDDNPRERALVKGMLPDVVSPDFPEKPYELPAFIHDITRDYFQIYQLTNEDIGKSEQYKANAHRISMQKTFDNADDYLRSLEIELLIEKANETNIARIAQMTQKTNQFNLTTRRYTDDDIKRFLADDYSIYALSVKDKFGDNGITGVIIVKIMDKEAYIDSMLLSCRILGRGIDGQFLNSTLNLLKDRGVNVVKAEYIPTVKNNQVADFYKNNNFTETATNSYTISLDGFESQDNNGIYKIQIL